jgi:hypothetical protein
VLLLLVLQAALRSSLRRAPQQDQQHHPHLARPQWSQLLLQAQLQTRRSSSRVRVQQQQVLLLSAWRQYLPWGLPVLV